MSPRGYRRLTRYAALAVAHAALLVIVVLGVADGPVAEAAVIALAVPLVLSLGYVQADIALNPELDEVSRTRWRVAVWCLPWAVAVYWFAHVRSRAAVLRRS